MMQDMRTDIKTNHMTTHSGSQRNDSTFLSGPRYERRSHRLVEPADIFAGRLGQGWERGLVVHVQRGGSSGPVRATATASATATSTGAALATAVTTAATSTTGRTLETSINLDEDLFLFLGLGLRNGALGLRAETLVP